MDTLRLKPRAPVEEEVENWDDDDFMIDDDLTFGNGSTTGLGNRRDSHNSFRSDRESLGGDEERLLHLPGDDEKSTLDAIAAVTNAGIPIPKNVPPSALIGGTIKRLGGKKLKKIYQEDWGDDLELPSPGQALRIKQQDGSKFPETLRQVSGGSSAPPSPVKSASASFTQDTPLWDSPPKQLGSPMVMDISPKRLAPAAEISPSKKKLITPVDLDRFRDNEEDDDVFGEGEATIKASKLRAPISMRNISMISQQPTPAKVEEPDDFEADLELPSHGKLNLSSRRDIPRTPALSSGDDLDWCEGSLGTRFGGTRRDAFSARSSSASALSPSIASSITAESEDEALDGIVLPTGPLDLTERLKRRKQSRSPERELDSKRVCPSKDSPPETPGLDKGDDLDGLEIGDGEVFGSGKTSMHRNVRLKDIRPMSPARPKTAVSITFSNKPVSSLPTSRLPRPLGHERSLTQSSLEPVSESGDPIPSRPARRPQSRLGHSNHSSVSSLHTPTTPSSTTSSVSPATPRRRELGQKASAVTLRNEPTTTNAQLLRLKRSLPVLRGAPQSPARPLSGRWDRPPSRDRPTSSLGPKTPLERARPSPSYEGSAAQARKNSAPFLPAGASSTQSQHVSSKFSRAFRRHDSDVGPEIRPLSRTFSSSSIRSPSPRRRPVEKMAAEPWHNLNKPRRIRQFGDGSELDAFDDLPTSAQVESKYEKVPSGSGNRTNIRNKLYQNVLPGRSTPSPVSPFSPAKQDNLPHFARDTAASRMAREASLANRAPQNGPLAPITSQRLGQISTRGNLHPHSHHSGTALRQKKTKRPPQLKPHLITNLNPAKDSKVVNGMTYNPDTYRWEGNENALNAFEVPASSPSTASLSHSMREKEASTPRPMLIQAMGSSKGVRRVGDMIFDPDMFTWHKVDPNTTPTMARPGDPMDIVEEDDDPFKDIPDLEEKDAEGGEGGPGRVSEMHDDWLVGEEFDVGPEFVRRQREEEDRWRKKCEKWVGTVNRDNDAWRWAIRDIVTGT
ncbi:Protein byr4 [Apiospora rasikravindrae]|uniref:Protein byr4 n=1 Tax=Apiospora rasikravindrae TaxID=990691 RepID=A0ABR1SWM1_9PEZI